LSSFKLILPFFYHLNDNVHSFYPWISNFISDSEIVVENSNKIGIVFSLHFHKLSDALEIKESGKFKTCSSEFSWIDVLGKDDCLVFPNLNELISSFFIRDPTFNGCRSGRRLSWTRSSSSTGRNLSARWFCHGTDFWEWEIHSMGLLEFQKRGQMRRNLLFCVNS